MSTPSIAPDASVHLEQARARFPGPDYRAVLRWVHEWLEPHRYVEVGVRDGASLQMAGAATRSLGIDPCLRVAWPTPPGTTLVEACSDDVLGSRQLDEWLSGAPLDLAFIDGLHLSEQVLRDFVHLERVATRRTVIALHDTLPLDEVTAARTRTTAFYTGDVWRTAACLVRSRRDLAIVTVPTFPTGLTLVTGFHTDRARPFEWYQPELSSLMVQAWPQPGDSGTLIETTLDDVIVALTAAEPLDQ